MSLDLIKQVNNEILLNTFQRANLADENVISVFLYGSRVYGNYTEKSDSDFIVVVKNRDNEQFSDNRININFYTQESHQQRLDEHEISALETYFLNEWDVLRAGPKYNFKLDLAKLRHSLSKKSSNSWVKCKKKLTVPEDYDLDIGRKSMFHAFRIIDFGIQIAKTGRIEHYGSCNELFKEIFSHYDWETLFETFKPRYNALLTEFRSLTHK